MSAGGDGGAELLYLCKYIFEPRHDKNPTFCIYAKPKAQISFAVTAKLISAFVFATRIVLLLYFLNPKLPKLFSYCY